MSKRGASDETRKRDLERNRRWQQDHPDRARASRRRSRHGHQIDEAFGAMWDAQRGLCYLCGDPLTPEQTVIEHDHSCCAPDRSCAACRRGLACRRCNVVIGQAGDDPYLLRLIADRFTPVHEATRVRIAAKPSQDSFPAA